MKAAKILALTFGLLTALNCWASEGCTFFVDDIQSITSNETEVSSLMVDSTMVTLEDGVATIGTFRATLTEKQDHGYELVIADSHSGSQMKTTFPTTNVITGSENGAVLKTKLAVSTGNFEVGSMLYIGAKKTLFREASVYCFE